jgi:exopolysaccharide production protein ExoZ
MNSHDKRYDGVQGLRLLAALLVVTTHSFFFTSERLGAQSVAWPYGARGVDIFFVISGFVMVISSHKLIGTESGWARFAIQRLIRIVPLYWLATTIKVFIMVVASSAVLHATWDTGAIVGSYFFIPYRKDATHVEPLMGVGWTLVFEMFFYFVFTLALYLRANIHVFVGIVMVSLAAMSFYRPDAYPAWMYLLNPVVLEFWFGMLVGYLILRGRNIALEFAAPLAIVSLLLVLCVQSSSLPPAVVICIPTALLVYAVASMEDTLAARLPRFIVFLGAASYSLYLFHSLFAPAIPTILRYFGVRSFSLSVVISISASVGLSALVYSFVELPTTMYLKSLRLLSTYTHRSVIEAATPSQEGG